MKNFSSFFLWFTCLLLLGIAVKDVQSWYMQAQITDLTVWNEPTVSQSNLLGIWNEELAGFEDDYFKETGKSIRVKSVARKYIQQQFVTVMAGGKGPDVVKIWVGAVPTLARQGFLLPMNELIKKWPQSNMIPEVFWEPARYSGELYGVPCDSYFNSLLVRKDLYEKAGFDIGKSPADWDSLLKIAVKLTVPEKGQYGFGFSPAISYFVDFVWQAGGQMLKADSHGFLVPSFQENPAVTALSFLRKLRFEKRVMQPNPLASKEELEQLFALGKLAMMPGVPNQMADLINRYGMNSEDLLIFPLPAGPSGLRASHSGGDYYVINAAISPEKRKAAWAYIEYKLSPLTQLGRWRAMKQRNMPIFPGAFSVATSLVNQSEFKMIKEVMNQIRTEPYAENWPQIRDYLDTHVLQPAFTQENADVVELLRNAAKRVEEELL